MSASVDAFDVAIVGGGIMGCIAALRLAEGGMRVVLVERSGLGSGATGVNAGTLSLQIKRVSLMAHAMRGVEIWSGLSEKLGTDIHFRQSGGLNLAFTVAEEERLVANMTERREAGLPIEFLSLEEARRKEPNISASVRLASYCPWDGYASSSVTGRAFRKALPGKGVVLREGESVEQIHRGSSGFDLVTSRGRLSCANLLLTTGAWSKVILAGMGVDLPVGWRVNQMSVTERTTRILNGVIGHISGLMSLKQAANGTVIVGGGWQGEGTPGEPAAVSGDNLVNNLRFARQGLPRLGDLRIVRSWFGYDSFAPDHMPMAGEIPGMPGAYMIACVRGGFTIGPCIAELVADRMLEREPALPLFDPARFVGPGIQKDINDKDNRAC